jgi:hypothetical protein
MPLSFLPSSGGLVLMIISMLQTRQKIRRLKGRLVAVENETSKKEIVKGTLRCLFPNEVGKYPEARAVHHLDAEGNLMRTDHIDENDKL